MTERQPTTSDLWLEPEDDPREAAEEKPPRGEVETLLQYLRRYRTTLELKCEGLSDEQLARRSVPPSSLSLLGLLRHLAGVEHNWNRRVLQGQDIPRIYKSEEDRDVAFNGAVADPLVVADAWAAWRREVADAETWLAGDSFDRQFELGGDVHEVRDVVVHLIEEYARHVGHADLLRECVDGRTGQ